jgi:hypothetical protein
MYKSWHPDDVAAVVRELTSRPAEERSWPGAGNETRLQNGYHR